jgi:hypothetical protein
VQQSASETQAPELNSPVIDSESEPDHSSARRGGWAASAMGRVGESQSRATDAEEQLHVEDQAQRSPSMNTKLKWH